MAGVSVEETPAIGFEELIERVRSSVAQSSRLGDDASLLRISSV